MNRFYNFLFLLTLYFTPSICQNDTISIIQCFKAARENAAIRPQLDIMAGISELKIENASASNLPALSAFGKAWYQSDAINVQLPLPGNPVDIKVNPFQYNFGLELDQKIFDGGVAGKIKRTEAATVESDKNRIETDLYKLNDRVLTYFFNALLFDESIKTLELKQNFLEKRMTEMESGVKNGIVKVSERDKIVAEDLLTQQQIIELQKNKQQMLGALKVITNENFSDKTYLLIPDSIKPEPNPIRPELRFFDSEVNRLERSAKFKSAQNLPKLYAYGQYGYSYPGLNFFDNKANDYYIVGLKLSWTIFDWKQIRRESIVLVKQEDIIKTQRDDFDRNMRISILNENIEQEKLLQMIEMDNQIIIKRSSITASSASSLANGVITSSAYIDDLNAEIRARIDLETHKIKYQNSMIKAYLLKGASFK